MVSLPSKDWPTVRARRGSFERAAARPAKPQPSRPGRVGCRGRSRDDPEPVPPRPASPPARPPPCRGTGLRQCRARGSGGSRACPLWPRRRRADPRPAAVDPDRPVVGTRRCQHRRRGAGVAAGRPHVASSPAGGHERSLRPGRHPAGPLRFRTGNRADHPRHAGGRRRPLRPDPVLLPRAAAGVCQSTAAAAPGFLDRPGAGLRAARTGHGLSGGELAGGRQDRGRAGSGRAASPGRLQPHRGRHRQRRRDPGLHPHPRRGDGSPGHDRAAAGRPVSSAKLVGPAHGDDPRRLDAGHGEPRRGRCCSPWTG